MKIKPINNQLKTGDNRINSARCYGKELRCMANEASRR